ncbi:MRG/MORF4L-binding protein [Plecturocebus cupreus]
MGEAEVSSRVSVGDKGPGEAATSLVEGTVMRSPEVEACLFHATLGHKPVVVKRHFHMICIRDKFSQNMGRQVPSKVVWDHLSTMYDMQALHESESLPFPNSERNFVLSEEIIQEVQEGKVMTEEEMKEEMKEDVAPTMRLMMFLHLQGVGGKQQKNPAKTKRTPQTWGAKKAQTGGSAAGSLTKSRQ